MIDPIIFTFFILFDFGYLNLEEIFTTSLLTLIICRGIYVIAYYFRYFKDYDKELEEGVKLFSKNEKIYFSVKQISLILFGMIYFPIAVFISFYSLIVSTSYLKHISKNIRFKYIDLMAKIFNILIPTMGIIWFLFINLDYYSIAAIGISLIAYLHYGLRIGDLSLSKLIQKYDKRRFNGFHKSVKGAGLILLIAIPSTIITFCGVYAPAEKKTYMIEMRDGVKLATDVYIAPGSFGIPKPVILIRTPYGKNGMDTYRTFYSTQDYHLVIQDLRGTHDSEGGDSFLLFVKSYQDGVDTINWILDRSWCNGKIASAGPSALCINQYFYAGMNPEGLVAQQLWFGTPELYDHAIYQGSYHKSSVETWVQSTAPDNWRNQIDTLFTYSSPKNETLYNSTSLSIPIGPHYSNVSVYGIHIGGFYCHFSQGTIDGYIGYDDYGTNTSKGHQKLIMGPWTHVNIWSTEQGELNYPKNSLGFDMIFNWEKKIFDAALLGSHISWTGTRVGYYLMGDVDTPSSDWNYWRYAYDWPLDHEDDKWYFTSTGSLINSTLPSINKNMSYLYDPRDPVPNLGGQNQPFDLIGPMDQREIENRSDVLIFETPVLTESVETVGRIFGNLFVTSNCTDTDFTVKLTDVYPDGRSMLITDGSLTVRSRYNYTTDVFMSGNQMDVYELLVDCWSTAYVFAPGHKIRVAISSSNYPRFGANPNTGAQLAFNYLNYNIANNTLLFGPDYPSSIILPRLVNMSSTHTSY
ncbi:MAG: CocE/NonD family hydrolase [Candidatus Lokiarchaeota archaeon]|nr:CocE/NonD family hydrolase [Candidatus Lokiarchaeota archaeon]